MEWAKSSEYNDNELPILFASESFLKCTARMGHVTGAIGEEPS